MFGASVSDQQKLCLELVRAINRSYMFGASVSDQQKLPFWLTVPNYAYLGPIRAYVQ